MKKTFFAFVFLFMINVLNAQTEIPLYDNHKVPNSKVASFNELSVSGDDGGPRVSRVTEPVLYSFLPSADKANGTAVIICPGGGYQRLAIAKEGFDVAKVLADWGVAAFVLKYRLPNDSIMDQKEIGPLQDAQRAIQLVRSRAGEWNINIKKVGIMGFSAGGHLASTAGTKFNKSFIENPAKINLRPDFMILMYPVISLSDSLAHMGSRISLIGNNPTKEMVDLYSTELQITKKTPRTFLVHAKDDKTVKYQNSVEFYEALQKNKVPAEIHLYEAGGHGFGLNNKTSPDKWIDWLKIWMKDYL